MDQSQATPDQADATLQQQRAYFASGRTVPVAARLDALTRLLAALKAAEADIVAALHEDLGKPGFEAYCSDILPVREEIRHAVAQLRRWAAPRFVRTRWYHWPARASVRMEPRGVVLVLGPWNYPVQLSLSPLVGAIAAGNCVVLKPSELAPATASVLARMLAGTFDPGHVTVVQGGAAAAARLTTLAWDHIFFTGSTVVGRAVAQAAAANLVTTTLELGGCNPCIVDDGADLAVTARRIVWAKFLNAGQTCLAPNHVLVHESRMGALVDALRAVLTRFYGADGRGLQRLVNARHAARVAAFLDQGRAVHGGAFDPAGCHIAPTLLMDMAPDASCLHEEIFGPVLPIVPWRDEAALLEGLSPASSPLVVHVHTRDDRFVDAVRARTRSGAVVVNDHIVQATVPDLPFGGVGTSGSGRAHGRAGFEAFSNARSLFRQSARIDLPLRYPPYDGKLGWVKRLIG